MAGDVRTGGTDSPGGEFSGGVVEVELAQGLGLAEALTIGIGTMIGAGIFVLPGIVIARAGPGALLSFLLGGVVALLSAMSAAEVATGMPKSGGGYYFISRALGPLWGAIIGWGSWFGLIFASAFYMVGFGEYIASLTGIPVVVAALVMTALLIILNLVGSQVAGKAQNLIVAILLGSLFLFAGRGAFSLDLGMLFSQSFFPFGLGAVVGGTATLFVSYCGFGEIASMAEEIRDPGKNLPRALLGSVIAVTVLYCGIIFVVLALRPFDELSSSTLVADLAGDLMGSWGRGALLVGAIMAMVSSANASIMSAARISFAMSRDRLIWDWLNRVHPRFRVPHTAILLTGGLILACVLIRKIELLAEAAGLLHLLLYALICVACIVMRGAKIEAYNPVYRVPWYPAVPILGALGCLGVALKIGGLVALMGLGLIAFAVIHYYAVGRKTTELRGAWPYFLSRGILQPALRRAEHWGAVEDEIPKAMLAVANPAHEPARLQIAAGMMGPVQGELLAVNVFVADMTDDPRDEVIARYYETIAQRNRMLREAAELIEQAGARVTSHVPVAGSVFCGLLSAAEASGASLGFFGWPERGDGYDASLRLLEALDRNLRAHMLVLQEQGPVPARNILALADDSVHGDLALLCAARLTNTWECQLSVAGLVPSQTTDEAQQEAEAALERRIGDRARASVHVILADSVAEAVAAEAAFSDMIILGVPTGSGKDLATTADELSDVAGCSIVLVRAYDASEGEPA